jgi:signal peptidase I
MTQPNKRPPVEPTPENPWLEGLKTVGLSAVLALGIRHFVAEARFIPSESMLPTLKVDDRLIVDKVSFKMGSPQRGDVVVFMPPDESVKGCGGRTGLPLKEKDLWEKITSILTLQDPSKPIDPNKPKDAFIKRVIGLPGETIEVKEGKVLVNGNPLVENYTEEAAQSITPPTVVAPNTYLVFGDNRNHSCDSRFWGAVPRENMIGKAVVRFWPLDRMGGVSPKLPYQN